MTLLLQHLILFHLILAMAVLVRDLLELEEEARLSQSGGVSGPDHCA